MSALNDNILRVFPCTQNGSWPTSIVIYATKSGVIAARLETKPSWTSQVMRVFLNLQAMKGIFAQIPSAIGEMISLQESGTTSLQHDPALDTLNALALPADLERLNQCEQMWADSVASKKRKISTPKKAKGNGKRRKKEEKISSPETTTQNNPTTPAGSGAMPPPNAIPPVATSVAKKRRKSKKTKTVEDDISWSSDGASSGVATSSNPSKPTLPSALPSGLIPPTMVLKANAQNPDIPTTSSATGFIPPQIITIPGESRDIESETDTEESGDDSESESDSSDI